MTAGTARKHRILVLGAGYAGASAAGRLAKRLHRDDVEITLVDAEEDFVERVRNHQLAVGQELEHRPFDAMFEGSGVRLKFAKVTAVEADRRSVRVESATGVEELAYDTLLYALGSRWNDHGVQGAVEYAHEISSRAGALRLRSRLESLAPGGRVLVVGGGLTGVEAVTEIAESRPDLDVALVARGGLGDWLSRKGAAHVRKVFDKLGITTHEHTAVTAVEADRVVTADGKTIASDATVWTTGFATHPIAEAGGLRVAENGQIVVDGMMRSVSHPEIYVGGDAGYAMGSAGKPLRMSCATGTPMAWQAVDAIAAELTGLKQPKVPLRYFNQCISLGRKDGLIQFVGADDTSKDRVLTGRTAAYYKELVCKAAAWAVANPGATVFSQGRRMKRGPVAAAAAA
ncbi:oxidoreductase [Streptomyces cinereoruber]|uniref:Oxidoreductase n=1 Tax=Streptomyces cinereoruber TaxID=67260 RepID=A0AAV4KL40_9ACTN|nr:MULTISPECIES: FAD-dependent oxidoreductase [Streptomyces]AVH99289.1 oxidoreductase [Streptomyces sp. WAC00288]KYG50816.1 oxidoreductase [Streptomyces sp. WAC04657]MBB4158774.1 NADH dehydrogenase FAD-containing subunit [Streptomyces cinereoruber]MBY8816511.1 FAD-dependent oxidoreductase [Streptomyces cinereoruber]NIH65294.1 NADH dehydrogenase FAD-containing subunit [Streptomyces cinereoruber]